MRRGGLGRGLEALIPADSSGQAGRTGKYRELPTSSIQPNPRQPRKSFDEVALAGLVDSVAAVGVLQPILVRQVSPDRFELIAGERRWRAARKVGLRTIPALVQEVDDATSLQQAVVENLHREDLGALEEASAYQELIEGYGLSHDEVAVRVGRSRAAVTNSLRLFQLPPDVQRMVAERKLSAGHARALLTSPDREQQLVLARRCVAEQMSVRALEEEARSPAGADRRAPGSLPGNDEAGAGGRDRRSTALGRASRAADRPASVLEVERLLSELLDTRVTVEISARRGRLVVEFATISDLERIFRLVSGGETQDQDVSL